MTDSDIKSSVDGLIASLTSPHSKRSYMADWARYLTWLGLESVAVTEVRPKHIEAHLNWLREEKKLGKATTVRTLSVLREVYGRLVRDEIMEVNPAREVKTPKSHSKPKAPVMDEDQIKALLALPAVTWKQHRDRICVLLLFGLAWRRSEVARLRVEDIEGTTVTTVVKGDKTLTVGVPTWLLDELAAWLRYAGIEEGPILPRSPDDPTEISGDIVYQIMLKASHRAGLPRFSPHSLRRTNITLGGKRGVSLKDRQMMVGHASQSTTERYDKANDAAENAPGEVFADLVRLGKKDSR